MAKKGKEPDVSFYLLIIALLVFVYTQHAASFCFIIPFLMELGARLYNSYYILTREHIFKKKEADMIKLVEGLSKTVEDCVAKVTLQGQEVLSLKQKLSIRKLGEDR